MRLYSLEAHVRFNCQFLNFAEAEGWGEKEIGTKAVSDGQKEGEWRGGAIDNPFPLSPFPSPLISNQTWPVHVK